MRRPRVCDCWSHVGASAFDSLAAYDYKSAGAYFVTVVAADRACLFGDIVDESVALPDIGSIVAEAWRETAEMRARVELDEFVVMPNHLHGILWLVDEPDAPSGEGTPPRAPTLAVRRVRLGGVRR